jgi:uncharacterized membrane protein YkgB
MRRVLARIEAFDRWLVARLRRRGEQLHRVSLGFLFLWFGLLKPFGHATASSLLAHSVWWGDPEQVVKMLGWWEVAIGVCLIFRPLARVALALLLIRLPGIVLALILKADVCFVHFPMAPTPEGQYLIKDLAIFFASIAIAGAARDPDTNEKRH